MTNFMGSKASGRQNISQYTVGDLCKTPLFEVCAYLANPPLVTGQVGVRLKFDGLVKSLQGRHSRERGSPEVIDFPGFPLSRE